MLEHAPPAPDLPASLAHLGALIGDPVRASILLHLSDGSCRPAGELAALAGASQQAASAHLKRLIEGGLLRVAAQGRHRFYALASGEIAETIEALAAWLEGPRRTVAHDPRLRAARFCYDHLAGHLGVAIFDRMAVLGFFDVSSGGPVLNGTGEAWCRRTGIPLAAPEAGRRPMLRFCLDWTERRPHLGGRFGALLARRMLDADLLRRGAAPRTLLVTARGTAFLRAELGLVLASAPSG